jgi:hypothetical protein
MKRWTIFFVLLCILSMETPMALAKKARPAAAETPQQIIYIPHDNRPISDKQTADVVSKLGYEVVVPPAEMLGGREKLGEPEELWAWLDDHAKNAKAAVISSDAMLYGSLVASRKHEYTEKTIIDRAQKFEAFHKRNPKLPLYVFGSIMRTPRSGEYSGTEEPGYYRNYGADIFRYTVLLDKKEVEGLTKREQKEITFLQRLIPEKSLRDWMDRRTKNFTANKYLIDLTKKDTFRYFVLGRDDNAPYSETHRESRHLSDYGKALGKTRFQSMAGIDEIGMLLLTRSTNDLERQVPIVYVRYNWGRGGDTVPSYSDEPISRSISDAITAAGGYEATLPSERTDLVLVVNTNPNGKTYEANDARNDGVRRDGTGYCAGLIDGYVKEGKPVGVADIAFANGADNALMKELKERGLLFKIRAYAGWNTATNSTGFVIGSGMLAKRMKDESVDELLLTRYLDDWAYQANVRTKVARQLSWLRGDGVYGNLGSKRTAVEWRATEDIKDFVKENLPPFESLTELQVTFPWNRMFEADILRTDEVRRHRHFQFFDE